MGVRQRRRTPTGWFRPDENFFWAGILLCVTFGATAAGIEESWAARQWQWLAFFAVGELGCTTLYIWIVASWLVWVNRLGDRPAEDEQVTFARERDHQHPGDI